VRVLWRCTGGQRARRIAAGVESLGIELTYGGGVGGNSGTGEAALDHQKLGEVSDVEAGILRCLAGPGRRWRGQSTAAQGGLRGRLGGRWQARVWGVCGGEVRRRGAGDPI
jgi:hypothetical protein